MFNAELISLFPFTDLRLREVILSHAQKVLGHRSRLRKQFLDNGLDSLLPYEQLELFLQFFLPRCDTKSLSKKILSHFGDIHHFLDASFSQLQLQGIGKITFRKIKRIHHFYSQYFSHKPISSHLFSCTNGRRPLLRNITSDYIKISVVAPTPRTFSFHTKDFEIALIDGLKYVSRDIPEFLTVSHYSPYAQPLPNQTDFKIFKKCRLFCQISGILLKEYSIIANEKSFLFSQHPELWKPQHH